MTIKKVHVYIALSILALLTILYFSLCKIASDHAMLIFNKTMSTQKVLKGSITLGKIDADIWGRVAFQDLVWLDSNGQPIIHVPRGRFVVKPLDIITRSISVGTLKKVELDNALFAVKFNQNMELDIFDQAHAKSSIERAKLEASLLEEGLESTSFIEPASSFLEKEKNLDFGGKRPDLLLVLNNCTLTADYKNRYFVLNDVNTKVNVNTKKVDIDFSSGKFGGTIIGDGIGIKGILDLKHKMPQYDLYLTLNNVLPASVGLADLKDRVSITAGVKGDLPSPVIDGYLEFEELNIPGLHFSKVKGDLFYNNAFLEFKNVTGNVYGGTVEAFGDFNLDTKYYNVNAKGKDLMASIAARDSKIKCNVELDFKIRSQGDPKTALTYGSFKSGKGSYYWIPFESLSGEFSNQNKVLEFRDVVIATKMGDIKTDAFKIINGKLNIGKIYFEDID